MSDQKLIMVRVLPERSLSLRLSDDATLHYIAGDELELPADEAKQLADDSIVVLVASAT